MGGAGVGFAALIVLSTAALELPGRAVPAVILVAVALLGSIVFLWRRRAWPVGWDAVCAGIVSLRRLAPFISSGRVGLPGVSLDDDTAQFLLYTETLRSPRMEHLWGASNGYPLGPHGVAATLSSATGIPLDMAFTGLLLAVIPITAMTAVGVLRRAAPWRRVLIGVMCALPYLSAAYYAQGSFKETVMALLLLAFVVHIDEAIDGARQPGQALRWRAMVPPGLLLAAAVYTYSYVAAAWFAGTVAVGLAATILISPRRLGRVLSPRRLPELGRWTAAAGVIIIVLLVPVADQLRSFFSSVGVSPAASSAIPVNALGNLVHPLPFSESLGVWWSSDFRLAPVTGPHHLLALAALALLVAAVAWSVVRRELLLAAAAVASLLIWWHADRSQSPYVAAKGLVIASPLVVALDLRMLLQGDQLRVVRGRHRSRAARTLAVLLGIVFCGCAAYSSELALRTEPVAAPTAGRELAAFHRFIGDRRVLYLGNDPYATWQLRAASVSALDPNVRSVGDVKERASKPPAGPLDFDSVDPRSLDHVGYVITSRTAYASQPPPNFRLVASATLFELWKRSGPTVPRSAPDASGAPGAVLDCGTPAGRELRRRRGEASVMAKPVMFSGRGLVPGGSAAIPLPLPKGNWELSLQYTSDFTLTLGAQGHEWKLPAMLAFVGQYFALGRVQGLGAASPVTLDVSLEKPSRLTGSGDLLYASFPTIAATRVPDMRRLVPLRRACGQYVDWYRLR